MATSYTYLATTVFHTAYRALPAIYMTSCKLVCAVSTYAKLLVTQQIKICDSLFDLLHKTLCPAVQIHALECVRRPVSFRFVTEKFLFCEISESPDAAGVSTERDVDK